MKLFFVIYIYTVIYIQSFSLDGHLQLFGPVFVKLFGPVLWILALYCYDFH